MHLQVLLLNQKCKSFYLQRCTNAGPMDTSWFCDTPVGFNKLQAVVHNSCENADLPDYYGY